MPVKTSSKKRMLSMETFFIFSGSAGEELDAQDTGGDHYNQRQDHWQDTIN
jgi:hypothetical protein